MKAIALVGLVCMVQACKGKSTDYQEGRKGEQSSNASTSSAVINLPKAPKLSVEKKQGDDVSLPYNVYTLTYADGSTKSFQDPAVASGDARWVAYIKDNAMHLYNALNKTEAESDTFAAGTEFSPLTASVDGKRFAYVAIHQEKLPTTTRLHVHTFGNPKATTCDVHAFTGCGAGCTAADLLWAPDGKHVAILEHSYDAIENAPPSHVGLYNLACKLAKKHEVSARGCTLKSWDASGITYDCDGKSQTFKP